MMMYCSLRDCTCNEFSSFSFFPRVIVILTCLIQDSVSPASQSCDNHNYDNHALLILQVIGIGILVLISVAENNLLVERGRWQIYALHGGMHTLIESLVTGASSAGVDVCMDTEVISFEEGGKVSHY